MGDVPTWIAVFVAAIGGAVALFQLRQQGDVLKGEVERNKRRDELLDSQLKELKERGEDRTREQAEQVDVLWQDGYDSGLVRNLSRRPINEIVAGLVVLLPTGGATTHHAGQWQVINIDGSAVTPNSSAAVPVLRPDMSAEALFDQNQLQGENRRLVVRFYDDAGRRWQLDRFMHLERAPEDGW